MKNSTPKKIILTALCGFGLSIGSVFAQNWTPHAVISQYWPNNDIKSYGGNLYAATNDGLYKSTDDGYSWTEMTTDISDLVEIQFTNNGNIFVRQNSFGIMRSLDAGTTWEYDTSGVGSNYGTDVLYYDGTSDRVFLGIGYPKYKLYYQSPADAGWTEVSNLPAGLNNFSPTQMTRNGNKLFVLDVYKRVLESSDNGITWIQKSGTNLPDVASQVGPGRFLSIGSDLYLGSAGVWKSSDDGDNWTRIDTGFALSFGLYVDTRTLYYDGSTLYTSVYSERRTYKSTDNGTSWESFGGTGEWFFKAMANHNGALFGVVHAMDTLYSIGAGPASVEETAIESPLTVFPNPANEIASIKYIPEGSTMKVFDVQGRLVYHSITRHEEISFNTSTLQGGLYTLQFESDGVLITRKLIIQH